jgi:hypothetical protein
MKSFLPPPVSPLVEEPMAAGGRQNLDGLQRRFPTNESQTMKTFTAARVAIG